MPRKIVVVRRKNGRLVKQSRPMSGYAAKKFADKYREKYDDTYSVELEMLEEEEWTEEEVKK